MCRAVGIIPGVCCAFKGLAFSRFAGSAMQMKLCTAISAIDYTGKRIRLVAFLRSVFLGSKILNDIEIVL